MKRIKSIKNIILLGYLIIGFTSCDFLDRSDPDKLNNNDVPIWEKYTLTIEEAAKYFRIGESKLRKLAEENPVPDWVMMNGNRIQIKRKQFEKMIDTVDAI